MGKLYPGPYPEKAGAIWRWSQSLEQQVAALWANGENGLWLDLTDQRALFQEASGATPVTAVAQPVGLALDNRFGLTRGPELYAGGDITGVPIGGPAFTNYPLGITATAGRTYEISCVIAGYSGSGSIGISGTNGTNVVSISPLPAGNGPYVRRVTYLQSIAISLFTQATNTANFTGISVREIPGNHAYQATAGSRFAYQGSLGGAFDGTDDFMIHSPCLSSFNNLVVIGVAYDTSASGANMQVVSHRSNTFAFPIIAQLGCSDTATPVFSGAERNNAGTLVSPGYAWPTPTLTPMVQCLHGASGAVNMRLQGVQRSSGAMPALPVTVNNARIGCTSPAGVNGNFHRGQIRTVILLDRSPTAQEILVAERWTAMKMGIALP